MEQWQNVNVSGPVGAAEQSPALPARGGHEKRGSWSVKGATTEGDAVGWAGQSLPLEQALQNGGGQQYTNTPGARGGRGSKNQVRGKNKDGRRAKGYRRLWEQVTKVGWGQSLEAGGKLAFSEMSVEDLVRVIQSLPPETSVVLTVSQALCYLDSRALAALLKELAKVGCVNRAIELFDWLRGFEQGHELSALCDVYTYTTMISLCGQQQQLRRALELVAEMRSRGIQCNVHTYSALMNVCIKCGELELALDVYKQMKAEGCQPNVVTYNTLIDVYGKTGQWEEAVKVLDVMQEQGLEPEIRTYNTAIIACNMCGQPDEALKVYERLRAAGHAPIATTYTALISAYGKAGELDKALETFRKMVQNGCERNIITYNALLATCEKGGAWELALQLFNQMHKEGCHPNTVTFNSLINVCAQAGKWEKASEIFERMKIQNCKPDSMTYIALLQAFEKGGQWHRAVRIFEQMVQQGCRLDTLVHHTIIDLLWQSGVVWAQAKAAQLFNSALRNYHVRLGVLQNAENGVLEASVPSLSVGVAVLSLHKWLCDTRHWVEQEGQQVLCEEVMVVVGRVRHNRENNLTAVKEAVQAMLKGLGAPVSSIDDLQGGIRCKARSWKFAEWLTSPNLGANLQHYVDEEGAAAADMGREVLSEDMAAEARCKEAFSAVKQFEQTHRLNYQMMGASYVHQRNDLVEMAIGMGRRLNLKDETIHDGVLLMDRVMSTGVRIQDGVWVVFVGTLVLISARQGEPPEKVPHPEQMDAMVQFPMGSVAKMEGQVRMVLNHDTAAISAIRVMKLYFERLGYNSKMTSDYHAVGSVFNLLQDALLRHEFLNFRPSVVAAALLFHDRKARGRVKFWPSSLAHLTDIHDTASAEFLGALQAAMSLDSSPYLTPPTVLAP
ncbi:hypothetical protein BSKO_03369 [Bryopsis sp. KO-2023]|nr:hypothetical protein BSKO_03369 [Bryopsis sp. KO-2023]